MFGSFRSDTLLSSCWSGRSIIQKYFAKVLFGLYTIRLMDLHIINEVSGEAMMQWIRLWMDGLFYRDTPMNIYRSHEALTNFLSYF